MSAQGLGCGSGPGREGEQEAAAEHWGMGAVMGREGAEHRHLWVLAKTRASF